MSLGDRGEGKGTQDQTTWMYCRDLGKSAELIVSMLLFVRFSPTRLSMPFNPFTYKRVGGHRKQGLVLQIVPRPDQSPVQVHCLSSALAYAISPFGI